MRQAFVGMILCSLLLAGCRQEDWKETSFELPQGVRYPTLEAALHALDRETPPQVTLEQGTVRVRYNSMRVSVRNLTYVRDELVMQQEKTK